MSDHAYPQFDDLISALPALEAKLLKGLPAKSRTFLDINGKYWFPGDLSLIPKIILGQTPAGYRKQQLLSILNYFLGKSTDFRRLHSHAELIFVKAESNKIRVLYPDFILKVVRKQSDCETPWFTKEIEGRKVMRDTFGGEIRVPRVIASGEQNGLYYLLEERLNCRPVNQDDTQDRQKIKQKLLPLLMDWYKPIRWDSMAHIFGEQPEAIVEKALTSSAITQMEPETVQVFHHIADYIDNYNIEVPVAMVHGDMNLLNICVTPKGKLVLVDWEKWGKHLIFIEFIYLARAFGLGGDIHRQIRQSYNRRFAGSCPSFDKQALVYYFLKCSQKLVKISEAQDVKPRQRHLTASSRMKARDISESRAYILRKLNVCRELLREINKTHESVGSKKQELSLS